MFINPMTCSSYFYNYKPCIKLINRDSADHFWGIKFRGCEASMTSLGAATIKSIQPIRVACSSYIVRALHTSLSFHSLQRSQSLFCAQKSNDSLSRPAQFSAKPSATRHFSDNSPSIPSDRIEYNITPNISSRVGRNLHLQPHHPLNLIKTKIENYFQRNFQAENGQPLFKMHDSDSPRVTLQQNFDDLLVPLVHPSRSPSDTYYYDKEFCLRTHTSAHQTQYLRAGELAFLVCGDVYRRDEIDASHYPIFHQMEGVKIWPNDFKPALSRGDKASVDLIVKDLKQTLEGLVFELFGKVEMRWIDCYFPFTEPSLELEIFFNNNWLEVLGCGVVRTTILDSCKPAVSENQLGWAFGLGLERLAMVLYDIPDIRLFWSEDGRFTQQFHAAKNNIKFQPFSKFPPCYKDISFWLPQAVTTQSNNNNDKNDTCSSSSQISFHPNDLASLIREVAGDLVESVVLVSNFTHPKTQRQSACYRINYRALDRSLTNPEIDELQFKIRELIPQRLRLELR
jgi:phenylalanyl-tRNA synthetase alpha chain